MGLTSQWGRLFMNVALTVHLKRRDFKKLDKITHTHDQSRSATLKGQMDLDVTFGEHM